MRILITGVAGLIGGEIALQLAQAKHELVGNDDLSHNCRELKELPLKQTFTCSVDQLHYFRQSLQHTDLIIHCASPVGHARLTPEAQTAWKIVSDTQAILELAASLGARLISFSSSEVLTYAGETDIRAQYALGKLTSEAMVLGHPTVQGRLIRPYNVTGRHQRSDGGFVMARFRDAVKAGKPLTIFGTGEQVRHFTHVSDFARFVCLLAQKWPEKQLWHVFNPGNRTTINGLARLFHQGMHVNGQTERVIHPEVALDNPWWRDSGERPLAMAEFRACVQLGWRPKVGLEEIVQDHLA